MATPTFNGLRVLALESRRATEVATLITAHGGRAMIAPALREVPLESNHEALSFARALVAGNFDVVIFLTGVGTRALVEAVEHSGSKDAFLAALRKTRVVARGPKPLAVLRDLGVPIWVTAPEPNTWREVLAALDAKATDQPLTGARVAVQEYGVSNTELLDALRSRGAQVTRVPVYKWALPEDVTPLKHAVRAIVDGTVDVIVFTTGVQATHLWQIAEQAGLADAMRQQLQRTLIASIGPTTSEELRRHGLTADLEPSHPKMGLLIRETAERSQELLPRKRTSPS